MVNSQELAQIIKTTIIYTFKLRQILTISFTESEFSDGQLYLGMGSETFAEIFEKYDVREVDWIDFFKNLEILFEQEIEVSLESSYRMLDTNVTYNSITSLVNGQLESNKKLLRHHPMNFLPVSSNLLEKSTFNLRGFYQNSWTGLLFHQGTIKAKNF